MTNDVVNWLREPPGADTLTPQAPGRFSYDDWYARGRALPRVVEILIELLEREDLEHPSWDSASAAGALQTLGDQRRRGVDALLRVLGSKSNVLRSSAASALGTQADASVVPLLEKLLADEDEDINVRENACGALIALGSRSSLPVIERAMRGPHHFYLRHIGERALRELAP